MGLFDGPPTITAVLNMTPFCLKILSLLLIRFAALSIIARLIFSLDAFMCFGVLFKSILSPSAPGFAFSASSSKVLNLFLSVGAIRLSIYQLIVLPI